MSRASRAAAEEAEEARHREHMDALEVVTRLLQGLADQQRNTAQELRKIVGPDSSGKALRPPSGWVRPAPTATSREFGPRIKGNEHRGGTLTITPATGTSSRGAHLRVSMPSQVTTQVDGAQVDLWTAAIRADEHGPTRAHVLRVGNSKGARGPWRFSIAQEARLSSDRARPLIPDVDTRRLPLGAQDALCAYAERVMEAEYPTFDEATAGAIAAVKTLDSWARDADAPRRALEDAGRALVAEAQQASEAPRVA